MKIILTEDQYEQLTEMIKLDIKVGDTIMGGKFKNKKVVVKTIGKNDKGDITINGKPLLRFRIIKESNNAGLRRRERIEELFHDYLLSNNVTPQDSFEGYFQSLCWNIAINVVDRSNVTLRNQIIQFIKNHFYEEFKGWWERKQKRMGINENSSRSEKIKKYLKNKLNIDFTDKIQQITSTYDVPTSFDDGIAPSTIRTYLNHWGPMYLVKIDGENYLYQDRGDFEMFIDEEGYWNKDEIPEKLGISVLGLRFSDILDMYFYEEDQI
jgi:hypothetical protein